MNIITKKVRLIPAPFVGSILKIQLGQIRNFKFRKGLLADGCERVVIDWGDGSTEEFTESFSGVEHNYADQGNYAIRISDGSKYIGIGHIEDDDEFCTVYAPMVVGFYSNAQNMNTLSAYTFKKCVNLAEFDVSASAINKIGKGAFTGCSKLVGKLYFPKVDNLEEAEGTMPFTGCSGITELHFAKEHELEIKSLDVWELSNHNFGAENAAIFFDL